MFPLEVNFQLSNKVEVKVPIRFFFKKKFGVVWVEMICYVVIKVINKKN